MIKSDHPLQKKKKIAKLMKLMHKKMTALIHKHINSIQNIAGNIKMNSEFKNLKKKKKDIF